MSLKSRTPLGRSSGLRSAGIKRGGKHRGLNGRNAKRAAKEFARAYHSLRRVKFVESLPCAQCGAMSGSAWIVNAHTKTGGTSRKGDYATIIPLCQTFEDDGCHDLQHQHGWSALPNLDTPDKRQLAALNTEGLWQTYQIVAHLSHHGAE